MRQSAASDDDDMSELNYFPYGYCLVELIFPCLEKLRADSFLKLSVPEPRLDTYVVCRSKRHLGALQLDDGEEDPINIEADDLYALPYKSIKPLVESGQINLV